jgi:hypothetical protein
MTLKMAISAPKAAAQRVLVLTIKVRVGKIRRRVFPIELILERTAKSNMIG